MFGPRITTVFASRWKALWWSAGILMTAYCTVPSAEQTQQTETKAAAAAAPHKSPWDKG
jgi:hypothetical protein